MEAKTALSTGQIKTPSHCSKWTSESGRTEEGTLETTSYALNGTTASSGEEYKISRLEGSNSAGSGSTDEEALEDSNYFNSEESAEEEDDNNYTADTTNEEEDWEPDDSTNKDCNSSTDINSEVHTMREFLSFFGVHEYVCKLFFHKNEFPTSSKSLYSVYRDGDL